MQASEGGWRAKTRMAFAAAGIAWLGAIGAATACERCFLGVWVTNPANGHEYCTTSTYYPGGADTFGTGDWWQAEADAVACGGHLVTIRNAAENEWLMQALSITEQFWIGLTDWGSEGSFYWLSGEPVTYTNWAPEQPDDDPWALGADTVFIENGGTWADVGSEIANYAIFERIADTDADGVPDPTDNCPSIANPSQADGDDDGFGDACDNCPAAPNVGQADGDGDGRGDACDNCPSTSNASQADGDADGAGDACDNCLRTPNAGQIDTDGDSCGDVCDPVPVSVRFTPRTLNKQSQGNFIKLHLSLAPTHTAAHIDATQPVILSVAGGPAIPDVDRQITGSEIDISFPRLDVANTAPTGEAVPFSVTGLLTYGCGFAGVDLVRVIQEGKPHTEETDPSSILDDAPRGDDVEVLRQTGNGDLGPTTCLVDYHSNYDFTVNTDAETPPSKKVFFYLFKFCNGTPTCSYGQTSSGQERTVGSGGCP